MEDRTLADIKKSLSETMGELDRSILIIIDDVDRLNDAEILEVFQLVKINADSRERSTCSCLTVRLYATR
jgi:KAP family P-loop domain